MKKKCWMIFFLLLPFLGMSAQEEQDQAKTTLVKAEMMAPDFTVNLYKGGTITLSELRGKVVLLNFWATWCGPCLKELKEMPELLKEFEGKDFVFLPVGREEKTESLQKFFDGKGKANHAYLADFTGMDPERAIYGQYATQYVPRSFVIDKQGKVVLEVIGAAEADVQRVIQAVRDELKK